MAEDLRQVPAGEYWRRFREMVGGDSGVVVDGAVSSGGYGRIACRLSLRDRGRGDRVVASAVGVFRVTGVELDSTALDWKNIIPRK